jgi:sortase A
VKPIRYRKSLAWLQKGLLTVGLSALGYCAFVFADAEWFQATEGRQLERLLIDLRQPKSAVPTVAAGGVLGRIAIPRLGISVIVIEGTSTTTLRRAVGHITDTSLPGQPGNVGIAGHRDTFFRPLKDVIQKDVITFTTIRGEYRYRVVSTRVVEPSDITVLDPSGSEILTLVTCYPFYFVGSAPGRYIVRAERIT